MKTSTILLLIASVLMVFGLAACEKAAETRTMAQADATADEQPQAMPASGASTGKVVETMDAGGYTYALLDTGAEKIWTAGPVTPLEMGQEIVVSKSMPMQKFHSKALERDFEVLYFVGAFEFADGHTHDGSSTLAGGGGAMGGMAAMGDGASHSKVAPTEVEKVAKAEGGFTVAELFSMKSSLGGETVKLRGQVVKFTPNIMGTNWVHIQDGTGQSGMADLTVTTGDVVAVGDVVLVEGQLTLDKDFGAGYRYDAIIEGAKLTKE